jgi:hypothetical protein
LAETIDHKMHKKREGFGFPGLMGILPDGIVPVARHRGNEPLEESLAVQEN